MRIAIVRLSAMGDIIQSMVVLQFIKKKYPNASIDWIVDSQFANLLHECPYIDNIIALDIREIKKKRSIFKLFEIFKKLRRLKKYDLVFDLQGLIKSAIIAKFIPSTETIGFDKRSIREKLASYFYSRKYYFPYHQNVIERYIGLLASSLELEVKNIDIINKEPFFNLSQTKFKRNQPTIVFILGASFASKIYPVEKYVEVVKSLDARFIALWHSEEERLMAEKLRSLSSQVSIVKCQSFEELKEMIINSDIVIGGDTGPTHLAWGLNKPSITIFGPTPLERNCFITDKNLAITSGSMVNPYKINKQDYSINQIKPEMISSLIRGLL